MTTTINQKVYQIIDEKGKETFETMNRQQYAGLRKSKRWKTIITVKACFSVSMKIKTI